jgi:hypothetical protein
MRREDVQSLFKRIPEVDHTKVVAVLAGGVSVNVDLLYRMDEHFLTVRGREAGSNDEGRAFFLPYETIHFLKIEKMVRVSDLEDIFGTGKKPAAPAPAAESAPAVVSQPTPPPAAGLPTDPAGIARANLLARLQAARTGAKK